MAPEDWGNCWQQSMCLWDMELEVGVQLEEEQWDSGESVGEYFYTEIFIVRDKVSFWIRATHSVFSGLCDTE